MVGMDGGQILIALEILGVGFAIASALIRFYGALVRKLQNHEDRLNFIEERLERIERKIDVLNGRRLNGGV